MMVRIYIPLTILFLFFAELWAQKTEYGLPRQEKNLLRIASYNILFQNNKSEEISKMILRNNSDIVLILEYNGYNIELDSLQAIGYRIHVSHPRFNPGGIALIAQESIHLEGSLLPSPVDGSCSMPLVVARVQCRYGNFAVIGIHAPPPFHRCKNQTYSMLTAVAGWIFDGKLICDVGKAKRGDPVILLGDFNTASFNPVLDVFASSGLKDAYAEHHYFSMGTWSPVQWMLPVFRIDFIYISNNLISANAWHDNIPGSDHSGVIADILFERKL